MWTSASRIVIIIFMLEVRLRGGLKFHDFFIVRLSVYGGNSNFFVWSSLMLSVIRREM